MLLAAVHGDVQPDETVRSILAMERSFEVTSPRTVARLQAHADEHARSLRDWLSSETDSGRSVLAYGAASRAVALFSRANIDSRLLGAVADASPAKQGRRMPGTDIPIVSPEELVAAKPDRVLLTLPDLFAEVNEKFPELAGRWKIDGQ